MAYGPGLMSAGDGGGNGGNKPAPAGPISAALEGGRSVLDRNLRELVRLVRAHMPVEVAVEVMMAVEAMMMPAHPGIGVHHARLGLHRLDERRLRGFRDRRVCRLDGARRHRRCRENGNRE